MYHILISSDEQEKAKSQPVKINITGIVTNYYDNQEFKPDTE